MRFGVGVRFSNTGQLILPVAQAFMKTQMRGLMAGGASISGLMRSRLITGALITATGSDPRAAFDGSLGAVPGTLQFPTLLNTYGANRPSWDVPGVDYAAGQASGLTVFGSTSTNPTQANINTCSTGATISGSTVTLSGANPSLGNATTGLVFANNTVVVVGSGASGTVTIQNCVITLSGQGGQQINCPNGRTCNLTVLNCEINGSQYASSATQFTDVGAYFGANGKLTVHYSYLHGLAIDAIQIQTGASTFDIQYNAFAGIGYSPNGGSGGHPDIIQHDGNASCTGIFAYNLVYAPVGSGQAGDNELLSVQSQSGAVLGPVTYANNTIISAGSTGVPTCSLIFGSFVEDTSSTILGSEFIYNWIDPSGVKFFPPYYGSSSQLQVTTGGLNQVSGNVLMTTGAASNPSGSSAVGYVAPGTVTNTSGSMTTDVVSAAASPSTGTETTGNSIVFTITYARTVTESGASLTLSNGATASYTSGSGTTALVFTYTVSSFDTSASNLAISSVNGTIIDLFGNSMSETATLVTFTGLTIAPSSSVALVGRIGGQIKALPNLTLPGGPVALFGRSSSQTKASATEGGWPNATNTGTSGTLTTSAITTLAPGTNYNNLSFTASSLTVGSGSGAINVTNCLFTAQPASNESVLIPGGYTGTITFTNCEMIGAGTAGVLGNYGILNSSPCSLVVAYCNLHEYGQPININGATGSIYIHDSYVWHLLGGSGTHYECLYYGGGGGAGFSLNLQHNTFINEQSQTAALFIQSEFGDVSNITINNNFCSILGGGDDPISLNGTGYTSNFSNISVTNNVLQINAGSQFFYTIGGVPSTGSPGTVTNITQSGNTSFNTGLAIWSNVVTYALNQIIEGTDGWRYKSLQNSNLNNIHPNSGGSNSWWSSSGLGGFVG